MHVLFLHVFCDFRLIRTAFTAKKAHRLYRHLLLNAARWHGNARVGLYFVIRLYMIVQASFRGEAFGTWVELLFVNEENCVERRKKKNNVQLGH